MAWELAGYAAVIALLAAAVGMVFTALQAYRTLRRWDRRAESLAVKAEAAADECVRLAREAHVTAETLRRTIGGFARLSEGARAIGEAAESIAQTAADAAYSWKNRLAAWTAAWETNGMEELPQEAPKLVGMIARTIRERFRSEFPACSRDPEANADPNLGE